MLEKQVFAEAWAALQQAKESNCHMAISPQQAMALISAIEKQHPAPDKPQTITGETEAVLRRAAVRALNDCYGFMLGVESLRAPGSMTERLRTLEQQIAWFEVGAAPEETTV